MLVTHLKEPFEMFLLEEVFSEEQLFLIKQELNFITNNPGFGVSNELGTATLDDGTPKAKREGVFIDNFFKDFRNTSRIYRCIRESLYKKDMIEHYAMVKKSIIMSQIYRSNTDSVLISLYKNGDRYLPHFDVCRATAIFYLSDESKHTGGELLFTGTDIKITPKNNTGIIFPGCMEHEVTELISEESAGYTRVAISVFIDYDKI